MDQTSLDQYKQCLIAISEANLTQFESWLDQISDRVASKAVNVFSQGIGAVNASFHEALKATESTSAAASQAPDVTDAIVTTGADCASYTYGATTFVIVIGALLIIFGILLFCGIIGSYLDTETGAIVRDRIHQVYLTSQGNQCHNATVAAEPSDAGENTDANTNGRAKNADLSWPAVYWIISGAMLIVAGKSGQELIGLISC